MVYVVSVKYAGRNAKKITEEKLSWYSKAQNKWGPVH